MDLVSTAINASVIGAVGWILGWLANGRFKALDKRMDGFERRLEAMHASINALRPRSDSGGPWPWEHVPSLTAPEPIRT
jgi:hypothetical protein